MKHKTALQSAITNSLRALAYITLLTVVAVNYHITPNPSPPSLIFAAFLAFSLTISLRRPQTASIVFTATLLISAVNPRWQLDSFVILSCIFLFIISTHGRRLLIATTAGAIFTIGLVDGSLRTWNFDPIAVIAWVWNLTIPLAFGYTIGVLHRGRKESQRKREKDLEQQRSKFAITLHDSVVAQLTSVIMKTQIAALNHRSSPQTRAEFEQIASEARKTMAELRELVDALHTQKNNLQKRPLSAYLTNILKNPSKSTASKSQFLKMPGARFPNTTELAK